MQSSPPGWQFIDAEGTFRLKDPHLNSYLYFPLVNEAGLMSAITPTLNGDIKTGQNSFLTLPVSMEDLHNTRSARNFWVQVTGFPAWSITGNSAAQLAQQFTADNPEEATLEAGFLWHRLTRTNRELGLQAQITNFVPDTQDQVELMQVSLSNLSDQPVQLTATAAIPIYGRSADDLRDHRHVTSLLHRIQCSDFGVLVRPTLSFDERGHLPNRLTYAVLGTGGRGEKPAGFYPLVEEFIGEGGALDWPAAIIQNLPPGFQAGQEYAGYESLGGVRFPQVTLQPGESTAFVLILAILEEGKDPQALVRAYGSQQLFEAHLQKAQKAWQTRLNRFSIQTGDPRFDYWMRWV
ncbi:MAG: cellobiose phosphorylase, partial [Anaerolineales bacterium]|nr:cellobiose phosphorylase [Anaerolineales bacterium]